MRDVEADTADNLPLVLPLVSREGTMGATQLWLVVEVDLCDLLAQDLSLLSTDLTGKFLSLLGPTSTTSDS